MTMNAMDVSKCHTRAVECKVMGKVEVRGGGVLQENKTESWRYIPQSFLPVLLSHGSNMECSTKSVILKAP